MKARIYTFVLSAFFLAAVIHPIDGVVIGMGSKPVLAHDGGSSGGGNSGGGTGGDNAGDRSLRPRSSSGNAHRDVRLAAAVLVQSVRTMREAQEALDLITSNPGGAAALFDNLDQFNAAVHQLHNEIRTARGRAHGAIQALTIYLSRVGFNDPKSKLKGAKLDRAHTRAAAAQSYSAIGNILNEVNRALIE